MTPEAAAALLAQKRVWEEEGDEDFVGRGAKGKKAAAKAKGGKGRKKAVKENMLVGSDSE